MEKEEFRVYKDTRYTLNGALWEVSNYGNVKKNGDTYIPSEMKNGYLAFGKNYYVHRAVAELFIPNTDSKPTVDHLNRNRTDNRVCNLRWATYKEQSENFDWERTRMKMSASRKGMEKSEEHRANLSKALMGNKNGLGHRHSEESKAKMRAAALGHKNVLGKVWVTNPTTAHSTMIAPSELPEYLDKGYVRGRKIKHLCNA